MEDSTLVLSRAAKRHHLPGVGRACLVHIYPMGPSIGTRYMLQNSPVVLGRGEDCHIPIDDQSVSRRHACIQPTSDGYSVVDLQSHSGTFVNEVRVSAQKLNDGDYLHIGNCIYRFLAGDSVEAQYHEEIYRLTITDILTGIHNKRYLMEFFGRELTCALRYHRPLALLLFDIDQFKELNDRLGHLGGDYTLRELAQLLRHKVRKEDLFARYGGDEFVVVMPETHRDTAWQIAEGFRRAAEEHTFTYGGVLFHLTLSLGISATTGNEWLTTVEMIRQADERLFQAKRAGRNRAMV